MRSASSPVGMCLTIASTISFCSFENASAGRMRYRICPVLCILVFLSATVFVLLFLCFYLKSNEGLILFLCFHYESCQVLDVDTNLTQLLSLTVFDFIQSRK